MFKRSFAVMMVLCAVAACALADDAIRKEIEGVYAKWCKLAAKEDAKGLMAMLHPDFVQIDINGGKTTVADFKAMMDQLLPITRNIKCDVKIERFDSYANEVTVWTTFSMTMQMKQGRKWAPQSFSMRQCEVLVKTNKGWQFKLSQDFP
jgi:ketosteroid isomerase-like protein